MNFFSLFQEKSRFFFVYLGFLGIINSIWASALLLLINNKVTNTALPFFDEYDWAIYLSLIVVSFLMAALFQSYMIKLSHNLGNELGLAIFDKIRFTAFEDFTKLGEEKIRTAMADVQVLQSFPNVFIESFNAGVMVLIGIAYLFYVHVLGAVMVTIVMIILASIYIFRNAKISAYLDRARDLEVIYQLNVKDMVRGFKEVKMSINRSDNIFNKYITKNRNKANELTISSMTRSLGNELMGQYAWYLMIGVILFVLPITIEMSANNRTNYLITLLFLMGPTNVVIGVMESFIRMKIAIQRLNEFNTIVNSTTSIDTRHGDVRNINPSFQSIRFKDITYEYLDENQAPIFSLEPLNIEFKRGESVFVTGGNGSGKSTFVNLLSGLFTPTSGSIYLNEHEINSENFPFYRDQLAAIFTDNYLFAENYDGLDLTEENERFMSLLIKMNLDKVVQFENGKNKVAHNLSKGQQKRMSLIYALLADKEVFIFDEWAAEQDPEFRRYFYKVIIPELRKMEKTVIAVTHDDAYFDCCSRLVKFDYGRIVKDEKNVKLIEQEA